MVFQLTFVDAAKYQKSGSGHKKLLKLLRHPNVLYHQGDGGRTPLNDEQITALMLSLRHKFQLIHGPPGEVHVDDAIMM